MERRQFLTSSMAAVALLSASKAFAGDSARGQHAPSPRDYHRLTNKDNPSVLEQKHVPGVAAPTSVKANEWFLVKTRIGYRKDHPSVPSHYITTIRLLIDGEEACLTDFARGGVAAPQAEFKIQLPKSATLEVIEHCNIHGWWISEPVRVTVA